MKSTLWILFTICSAPQIACAQGPYLWIGFSNNRVMLDVVLLSVDADLISVLRDGRRVNVSLDEIEQVRVMREGSMVRGAITGAGAGLVIGGIVGFLGAPPDDRGWRVGTTALATGIIGGIVGSVVGSIPNEDDFLDLRGRTKAERMVILENVLAWNAE